MGAVQGRADEMLKLRGISVYPAAIERVLRSFPELGLEWQLVVDRKDSAQEITVAVEAAADLEIAERAAVANRVSTRLKEQIGILLDVELVDSGKLFPDQEAGARVKSRRVIEKTDRASG
jgi:phenylacetate-CoA ligase